MFLAMDVEDIGEAAFDIEAIVEKIVETEEIFHGFRI
jgi:hypothetical protein